MYFPFVPEIWSHLYKSLGSNLINLGNVSYIETIFFQFDLLDQIFSSYPIMYLIYFVYEIQEKVFKGEKVHLFNCVIPLIITLYWMESK